MRRLRPLAHADEWPLQINPPQECRCGPDIPALVERTRRAEDDLSFERVRSRRVLGVAHAGTPSRHPARRIELSAQLPATSGQEGILAIPDYVSNTPDKPIIHFEERPSGTPEAIHT